MLVIQSCLTLCSPMHCSLPGSSVCGILQARVLEWVAIPFSRVSIKPRDWTRVSCIAGRFFTTWATRESESEVAQLCPTLCDPMAMGFSRQEYWSGLPFPSPEDLPNTGLEPRSPAVQADSLLSESPEKPKATGGLKCCCYRLSQIQTRKLPTAFQSIAITHVTTGKIPVCPGGARSSDLVDRSRADEVGLRTGRSPKAKWNLSEANPGILGPLSPMSTFLSLPSSPSPPPSSMERS